MTGTIVSGLVVLAVLVVLVVFSMNFNRFWFPNYTGYLNRRPGTIVSGLVVSVVLVVLVVFSMNFDRFWSQTTPERRERCWGLWFLD